jgi:hypothetical protein
MSESNRLQRLSTDKIIALANRLHEKCDRLMTEYASGGKTYGHGGALSFGWDMPTLGMIFPRAYHRFRAVITEGQKRGLGKKSH